MILSALGAKAVLFMFLSPCPISRGQHSVSSFRGIRPLETGLKGSEGELQASSPFSLAYYHPAQCPTLGEELNRSNSVPLGWITALPLKTTELC